MADGKCAHAGCKCQAGDHAISRGGQQYCSEHCATAGPLSATGNCGCGHAECK